jgi:hypothetical protein
MRTLATRALVLRLALVAAIALLPVAAPIAQAQGQPGGGLPIPITGTILNAVGGVQTGTVAGTFTVQRFATQGNALMAIGTFVGTLTDTATGAVQNVVTQLAIPVAPSATTAACEILHLVLGPLDLNLLGLVVHLNQVVLDITAVPGAGNLLGNLLCAVANLLNGPNPLGGLAALLNQILGALG